jgi:hypothetical protein
VASADEETDQGAGHEVEKGPHRPIVPGRSERESRFLIPTPDRGSPGGQGSLKAGAWDQR